MARVFLGYLADGLLIMSVAIELEDLSLGYGSDLAISKVDASIGDGSLTAIIGPNGAGSLHWLKVLQGF